MTAITETREGTCHPQPSSQLNHRVGNIIYLLETEGSLPQLTDRSLAAFSRIVTKTTFTMNACPNSKSHISHVSSCAHWEPGDDWEVFRDTARHCPLSLGTSSPSLVAPSRVKCAHPRSAQSPPAGLEGSWVDTLCPGSSGWRCVGHSEKSWRRGNREMSWRSLTLRRGRNGLPKAVRTLVSLKGQKVAGTPNGL